MNRDAELLNRIGNYGFLDKVEIADISKDGNLNVDDIYQTYNGHITRYINIKYINNYCLLNGKR
jgi:hypothetical protein